MMASRWHSPPNPALVLTSEIAAPSALELVGVEAGGDVALEHADAHVLVSSGMVRLEQRRLAGTG